MSDDFQNLRDEFKVPLGCHACNKLMYNIDSKYFYRYGICSECFIDWVDGRDLPQELFKSRSEMVNYIKQKNEEKKNR